MRQEKITFTQGDGNPIFTENRSEMEQIITDALDLGRRYPEIERRILADQQNHGKQKKAQRVEHRQWERSRCIPPLDEELSRFEPTVDHLPPELQETGRRRMSPELVYIFVVLRGYLGSITSQDAADRIKDSSAVQNYLECRGWKLPAIRTILDNINTLSQETLNYILDCQIAAALEEDLDDLSEQMLDSTSVEADSRWPTDADVIYRLLERAARLARNAYSLQLPSFVSKYVDGWLVQIKWLVKKINTVGDKSGSKKKRKIYYRRVLKHCRQIVDRLAPYAEEWKEIVQEVDLPAYQKERVQRYVDRFIDDLYSACQMHDQCNERVFNGKYTRAQDKVLSISDESAAFICKGDREPVIGYRVQLARSRGGLVCAVNVPQGNVADSDQLYPMMQQSIERSGVVPSGVTADDGYAAKAARDSVAGLGVTHVRLCGSKGKALTSQEEWDSEQHRTERSRRSAVESLMYVLKQGFDFARLHRRGIGPVRCEVLEKVIGYNFRRLALLRKRRYRERQQRAAA